MNKKVVILTSVFLFSLILSSILVSAATPVDMLKELGEGTLNILTSVAETIFGIDAGGENLFQAKDLLAYVLLFVLLLAIIWAILDKMPLVNEHTWVVVLISILVPLLSIRFLSQKWINAILLPYSTIGIAMTALLPLIIFFIFVEQSIDSRTFRKIAWIFAAVVFIGLYFSRLDELTGAVRWVYPIAALACIVFMLFDKTIQRAWKKAGAEATAELANSRARSRLMERRAKLEDQRLSDPPTITDADYNTQNTALEKLEKKYGIK